MRNADNTEENIAGGILCTLYPVVSPVVRVGLTDWRTATFHLSICFVACHKRLKIKHWQLLKNISSLQERIVQAQIILSISQFTSNQSQYVQYDSDHKNSRKRKKKRDIKCTTTTWHIINIMSLQSAFIKSNQCTFLRTNFIPLYSTYSLRIQSIWLYGPVWMSVH